MVNRDSTTIYSGMFPGLVAGDYELNEVLIDLRMLTDRAGVSLIVGEIHSLDLSENRLFLENRPPLSFSQISFDVGSETIFDEEISKSIQNKSLIFPVKPFSQSFEWIKKLDIESISKPSDPFTVVGSGLAAVEIAFALRRRWPNRNLRLQSFPGTIKRSFKNELASSRIELIDPKSIVLSHALLCTGNQGPTWLKNCGLEVNQVGRIMTNSKLQVNGRDNIFAVGDCGVIKKNFRPPAGVWAVRAALPLARNIERYFCGKRLLSWRPQLIALKLVGGRLYKSKYPSAWLLWGALRIGPHPFIWKLKEFIDRKFINDFAKASDMRKNKENLDCRGCAAKVSSQTLRSALKAAELFEIEGHSKDAAIVGSPFANAVWIQSVDGFPALLNDPWLNARISTLHSCSDLWARGVPVSSAQAVITLPSIHSDLQKEMLTQCLSGIKSALEPQQANLIGGHTFESRAEIPGNISLGIEIALSVNGFAEDKSHLWGKAGLLPGDEILISRGIGSGVIFAASMKGVVPSSIVDNAVLQLSKSQYNCFESLRCRVRNSSDSSVIHACTDITGFGLLGHLGEMVEETNIYRLKVSLPAIKINLFANEIPSLPGAKTLFHAGYESTLAPSNRSFWSLLDANGKSSSLIELIHGTTKLGTAEFKAIKELLVDPQTCGPLVISCEPNFAKELLNNTAWQRIGSVDLI